jgi:hypothetical protein
MAQSAAAILALASADALASALAGAAAGAAAGAGFAGAVFVLGASVAVVPWALSLFLQALRNTTGRTQQISLERIFIGRS